MDKKRLRGRVSTKANINQYYPKFVPLEGPDTDIIYNESELDSYSPEVMLYEPIEPGFGKEHDTLFIRVRSKTMVFSIPIDEVITWGNKIITFGDNYDFDGNKI